MQRFFYAAMLCLLAACSGNLVQNAGAETAPITGEWTIASGGWTQRRKAPPLREGKAYFFPSVALKAELFQDVDVSSYGLFTYQGLVSLDLG